MRRGTRKRFNRGGGVRGNSIAPGHRSVMGSNSSARGIRWCRECGPHQVCDCSRLNDPGYSGRAARCYCRNLSWK